MTPPDNGFKLLTAAEVADLFSVSERWVRDASREGRIPTVKLGRYRRFRREAVLAWIEAHEVEGRGRK